MKTRQLKHGIEVNGDGSCVWHVPHSRTSYNDDYDSKYKELSQNDKVCQKLRGNGCDKLPTCDLAEVYNFGRRAKGSHINSYCP